MLRARAGTTGRKAPKHLYAFYTKGEYKKRLQRKCVAILDERIDGIRFAMNEAQRNANSEEKSSAGDKYETSRAMSQLQKDMYATQLAANIREMENLLSVDCNKLYNTVQKGSLVDCEKLSFFIAIGLGKVAFEGKTVFLVSQSAPLVKILLGKKSGDTFVFNKEELKIKEVY